MELENTGQAEEIIDDDDLYEMNYSIEEIQKSAPGFQTLPQTDQKTDYYDDEDKEY